MGCDKRIASIRKDTAGEQAALSSGLRAAITFHMPADQLLGAFERFIADDRRMQPGPVLLLVDYVADVHAVADQVVEF